MSLVKTNLILFVKRMIKRFLLLVEAMVQMVLRLCIPMAPQSVNFLIFRALADGNIQWMVICFVEDLLLERGIPACCMILVAGSNFLGHLRSTIHLIIQAGKDQT